MPQRKIERSHRIDVAESQWPWSTSPIPRLVWCARWRSLALDATGILREGYVVRPQDTDSPLGERHGSPTHWRMGSPAVRVVQRPQEVSLRADSEKPPVRWFHSITSSAMRQWPRLVLSAACFSIVAAALL